MKITQAQFKKSWDEVIGKEETTDDDQNARGFLLAAFALESTDINKISRLSKIDRALCALYAERAVEAKIFDDGKMRGHYYREDSGMDLMLDSQVLCGTMTRTIREDGEIMFALTAEGRRYVEEDLLPSIQGES